MTDRGFAVSGATPGDVIARCAHEAETLGYRSFWTNYPGPPDGIVALGPAAGTTTDVDLAVGVVPLDTRSATDIVESVGASGVPLERLLLGVGSGAAPKGLTCVREGVAELRERLDCRIVVGALGPKMCRLAGEVGDAVLLNWLTPEYARTLTEIVRAGADAAGRKPPVIYTYVRLLLGPDARERGEKHGAGYTTSPAYRAHFDSQGVEPIDTSIAAADAAGVQRALEAWEGAVDHVVLRIVPVGESVEEHLELLHAAAPR